MNNTKTIKKGFKFNYPYADGNPKWVVDLVNNKRSTATVRCLGLDGHGVMKTLTFEEINSVVSFTNFWDNLKKNGDKDWFDRLKKYNLKEGDFVHDIHDEKSNVVLRYKLTKTGALTAIGIIIIDKKKEVQQSYLHFPEKRIDYDFSTKKHSFKVHKPTWMTDYVKPRIWSNRPSDFAELNGNTKYQSYKTEVIKEIKPTAEDKEWIKQLNDENSVYNKLNELINKRDNKNYKDFVKQAKNILK